MRKALPYVLVAVVAIAVVVLPRLIVYASDDFTVMPDHHKAFIYGFPFRIIECPPSPEHTRAFEAALRLFGNFVILFAAGIALVLFGPRAARRLSGHA